MEIENLSTSLISSELKSLSSIVVIDFIWADVSRDAKESIKYCVLILLLPSKKMKLPVLQIQYFILHIIKLKLIFLQPKENDEVKKKTQSKNYFGLIFICKIKIFNSDFLVLIGNSGFYYYFGIFEKFYYCLVFSKFGVDMLSRYFC